MRLLLGFLRRTRVPTRRGMAVDIGGMRKPYNSKEDCFDFKDLVAQEPFGQFKAWFEEASKHDQIYEVGYMERDIKRTSTWHCIPRMIFLALTSS